MSKYALRFISGKYQGGEFPLQMNSEIIIGRSSELDMVLVEDMVSRKHAKITTNDQLMTIQDMGSTNGTFVNGEKVAGAAHLNIGDRILVGTSIIKIVEVGSASLRQMPSTDQQQARPIAGSIEEIPLPDLMQLLSTSKKTGVVNVVTTVTGNTFHAKIYLRNGILYYATINDNFAISPRKAMFRLLQWTTGQFELEPSTQIEAMEEITESTELLLIHTVQRLDEYNQLAGFLPPAYAVIERVNQLPHPLRNLSPEQLDAFQSALEHPQVQGYYDYFPGTDLDAAKQLKELLDLGYFTTR
jgi:hypothetical protein